MLRPSTPAYRSKSTTTCAISTTYSVGLSPPTRGNNSDNDKDTNNHSPPPPPPEQHPSDPTNYLDVLPHELWLHIFLHLDIPDLVVCSRVCHCFRELARDPYLHRERRRLTKKWLDIVYASRPSSKDLCDRNILQSRQQLAPFPCQGHMQTRAKLARIFVQDSLRRDLGKRPTKEELIKRGVVKKGGNFAPQIVSLERQKAVDVLRGFLSGSQRPCYELAVKRGVAAPPVDKHPVRVLTRMFSYWREPTKPRSEAPPRAKVRKMTLLFEALSKAASPSSSSLHCRNGEQSCYTRMPPQPSRMRTTTATSRVSLPAPSRPRLQYDGVAVIRQRFIAVL